MPGSRRMGARTLGAWLALALGVSLACPAAVVANPEEPAAADEREAGDESSERSEGAGDESSQRSAGARDESWQRSAEKGFDAVVLRPLRAGQLAVGFAIFVASTPLTALARNVPEAWEILVVEPYESTFRASLGQP